MVDTAVVRAPGAAVRGPHPEDRPARLIPPAPRRRPGWRTAARSAIPVQRSAGPDGGAQWQVPGGDAVVVGGSATSG